MINYGYINSGFDEQDIILDDQVNSQTASLQLPSEYDYTKYLSISCKNQGNTPHCVPYSLGLIIQIKKQLDGINDYWIDIDDIFSNGGTSNGMMIRDALSYIKKTGYKSETSDNREKILLYGKLTSPLLIKQSVYINGPCILGLPVKDDSREDFWNGSSDFGGHAITCVGWDDNGLILMNSWGANYGYNGKTVIPYDDICSKVLECWAII